MVSASQQLIYMRGIGLRGFVTAKSGEIGGYLPVEQCQLPHFGAGELLDARRIDRGEQCFETAPVRASLLEPKVGDDNICHEHEP